MSGNEDGDYEQLQIWLQMYKISIYILNKQSCKYILLSVSPIEMQLHKTYAAMGEHHPNIRELRTAWLVCPLNLSDTTIFFE